MTASPPGRPGLASAVGWAYAMESGARVLTTVVTFVVAALLGPEAFGLIALALVYVMFIEMLQRQGMSSALVQRVDLQRQHLDAAFWAITGLSLVLTAGSISLSGWWAELNNEPQLQLVIVWMSALLPAQGLILIQESILRREMRFRPLAVRNTAAALVGGTLGIVTAFAGFGVWALVILQLATALTKVVLLWSVTEWRPGSRLSWPHLRDLLSFSSGSFLTSIAVFVNARADALFMGMFFGAAAIGLYRFADRLMTQVLALSLAGPSMISVALPALSRQQHDQKGYEQELERLVHVAVASSFPLFGLLAAVSEPLLSVVGDQWSPAVVAVQVLCLVGCAQALAALVQPVLQSLGHPHRQAALTWLLAGISAGSFVAVGVLLRGTPVVQQVTYLAYSRAAVYAVVLLPTTLYVFSRYGKLAVRRTASIAMPSVIAGGLAWVVGVAVRRTLPWGGTRLLDIATLAVVGLVAAATAGVIMYRTDTVARELISRRLRPVLQRARAAS